MHLWVHGREAGERGSVTAGHCYENNQSIYSGSYMYGMTTDDQEAQEDPEWDMIRIHPNGHETYDNKIWTDPKPSAQFPPDQLTP